MLFDSPETKDLVDVPGWVAHRRGEWSQIPFIDCRLFERM